jgi:hypothetical protein
MCEDVDRIYLVLTGRVTGSCERRNEHRSSVKSGELLDYMSYYQLLKNNAATEVSPKARQIGQSWKAVFSNQ